MKRPDLYPKVEWFEGMEVVRNSCFEKAKKYIDQIEAENKKLKEASSILNSLSKEKPCPACKNKMNYKPRLYHCDYCGSDFN